MHLLLELETPVNCDPGLKPFIVKLADRSERTAFQDADNFPENMEIMPDRSVKCIVSGTPLTVQCPSDDEIQGDVVLVFPRLQKAQRLIRRNSGHNTLLFTERCDQMCAMCSQPPKNKDYMGWLPHFIQALLLADEGCRVGISGGEPTLHIKELFHLLETVASIRQDLSIHILSNGQHFQKTDKARLAKLHSDLDILWGIPLYAEKPSIHEEIVGKIGSFEPLINNLYLLAASGAKIELRTVLTARNILELPKLANFISRNLPFIDVWAIMAMEPIGYAKANKDELFFDHSIFSEPLTAALDFSINSGISASLYNFPLCTIPRKYRHFCNQSISDWKRKYIDACEGCSAKGVCTGFFEWYTKEWQWENVSSL